MLTKAQVDVLIACGLDSGSLTKAVRKRRIDFELHGRLTFGLSHEGNHLGAD